MKVKYKDWEFEGTLDDCKEIIMYLNHLTLQI